MTDYSELKRLADDVNQNFPNKEDLWNMVCTPTIVLGLIADHDQLVSQLCVCRECGGRGEFHTGDWSDEGYFQPPEPVMAKCGECDGDGVIGDASDLTNLLAENAKLKAECEGLREQVGGLKAVVTMQAEALRKLTFHARTSGGTAGSDTGLMGACEVAEKALSLGGFGATYMRGADAAEQGGQNNG